MHQKRLTSDYHGIIFRSHRRFTGSSSVLTEDYTEETNRIVTGEAAVLAMNVLEFRVNGTSQCFVRDLCKKFGILFCSMRSAMTQTLNLFSWLFD